MLPRTGLWPVCLDARQLCGEHTRQGTCQTQEIGQDPAGALALFGPGLTRRQEGKPIAGTRLIREWQGVEHVVTVTRDGYEWQGRPYTSISALARAITGTRWNGWVFFGLKNHRRRA